MWEFYSCCLFHDVINKIPLDLFIAKFLELLEGLNRAQRARLEDQRGTEINFELPDFLKDSDNLQSCSKLRKILNSDNTIVDSHRTSNENIETSSKNASNVPIPSIRLSPGHKPNPAPRLSIGRLQNLPNVKLDERQMNESQVQSKINALEKCSSANNISPNTFILNNNFSQSPTIANFNSEKKSKSNSFEGSKLVDQNQSSNESCDDILNCSFSSESDKFKSISDPPPLPPKPKVLPMKPSNWGQNIKNISHDNHFKTSQDHMRNSENILKRGIYLDQHNSSFV